MMKIFTNSKFFKTFNYVILRNNENLNVLQLTQLRKDARKNIFIESINDSCYKFTKCKYLYIVNSVDYDGSRHFCANMDEAKLICTQLRNLFLEDSVKKTRCQTMRNKLKY